MNIAVITPYFPFPLNSGGAQAQYNMLDVLRKHHQVTLIYLQTRRTPSGDITHLKRLWPEVKIVIFPYLRQLMYARFVLEKMVRAFNLVFRSRSERFLVERALRPYGMYFHPDLVRFVNRQLEACQADVVQMEFYPCLKLVDYVSHPAQKVFVHHELRFVRNERLLEHVRLTQEEQRLKMEVKEGEIEDLNKYDKVITLTAVDRNVLLENGVKSHVYVSPAAVNSKVLPYMSWNHRLLFVGGYSHKPNVEGMDWFVHHVTTALDWSLFPEMEVHLVGSGWPDTVIQEYRRVIGSRFVYHGFVEDLTAVARGCIMVVPILTGSGMRMKILEAAAMALPFVTTQVGVEGLLFKDGESCLIGDGVESWKRMLISLMSEPDRRELLATRAQEVFKEYYSVEALAKIRMDVYAS